MRAVVDGGAKKGVEWQWFPVMTISVGYLATMSFGFRYVGFGVWWWRFGIMRDDTALDGWTVG